MVSVVPAITNWQIRSTSLTSLCVCVSVFGQAKLEFLCRLFFICLVCSANEALNMQLRYPSLSFCWTDQ